MTLNGVEMVSMEVVQVYLYHFRVVCFKCEKAQEFQMVGHGLDYSQQEKHLKSQYSWQREGGQWFCVQCTYSGK